MKQESSGFSRETFKSIKQGSGDFSRGRFKYNACCAHTFTVGKCLILALYNKQGQSPEGGENG